LLIVPEMLALVFTFERRRELPGYSLRSVAREWSANKAIAGFHEGSI